MAPTALHTVSPHEDYQSSGDIGASNWAGDHVVAQMQHGPSRPTVRRQERRLPVRTTASRRRPIARDPRLQANKSDHAASRDRRWHQNRHRQSPDTDTIEISSTVENCAGGFKWRPRRSLTADTMPAHRSNARLVTIEVIPRRGIGHMQSTPSAQTYKG